MNKYKFHVNIYLLFYIQSIYLFFFFTEAKLIKYSKNLIIFSKKY